jgi:hypothetical protein
MVKSVMVLLTERENVDVVVGWKLQPATETVVDEREKADMMWTRVRYNLTTTGTSLRVRLEREAFMHSGCTTSKLSCVGIL